MSKRPKQDVPQPEACREAALRLLDRKPHSTADLRRKLYQRKFPKHVIDPLINDLARVGLLDDLALARSHCENRLYASPPLGRRRVLQELHRHGIPQEIAEQALGEIWDSQERDDRLGRAQEAARRKLRLLRNDEEPRRKRDKLYRYLVGRGFDPEIIRDAVDTVIND